VRSIAVELAASDEGVLEELATTFAAEEGHACPKIDVRAAALRDGALLLVRGRDDNLWTLPGGWAEVGESPRTAAEKELREESGYRGRATKLVGVWERDLRDRPRWPFYAWKAYFVCDLEDGEPEPPHAIEVDEVGFFAPTDLPPLSRRTPMEHLSVVLAHVADPALPTVFD
jgi:ADP-ribose pyrophosphatase YjhB (NUDIX family)